MASLIIQGKCIPHMSRAITKSALRQMCSLYKFTKYNTSHITLTFWIATITASKGLYKGRYFYATYSYVLDVLKWQVLNCITLSNAFQELEHL